MNRSDESKAKRESDRARLRDFIKAHPIGHEFEILGWYKSMDALGLAQSARQRLSDLRAEFGLVMDFDKTRKVYRYEGFNVARQIPLFAVDQMTVH